MELKLSIIREAHQPDDVFASLAEEFHALTGINVHIRTMQWGSAWEELNGIGQSKRGADVSQIGSTWTGSLAYQGILHAFTQEELMSFGGPEVFHPATWESVSILGYPGDWAVPWIGDTHLIVYRKDLLQKAGVAENEAFSSGEALLETIDRLQNIGVRFPWLQPSLMMKGLKFHLGTNWVWSTGGSFLHRNGKELLFAEPEAIRGWNNFFEAYRRVAPAARGLTNAECAREFAEGQVAILTNDVYMIHLISKEATLEVRRNMGTAPMLNVPWFGGSHMVIWKHVEKDPRRFEAALELVRFLASKETQVTFCQFAGLIPARQDALEVVFPPYHIMALALYQASKKGRCYPPLPAWEVIENRVGTEIQDMLREFYIHPDIDVPAMLTERLGNLAEELNSYL
jgi:multiple sugar transport system substrate-binding protein